MPAPKGNKNAIGNKGGRPALYSDPEVLKGKVEEYFDSIKPDKDGKNGKHPSVVRLALFLGFSGRQGLAPYKEMIEFSDIIKRALSQVEAHYEESLNFKGCTGAIFALKNMGWKDERTVSKKKAAKSKEELLQELEEIENALNE